jgi:hypothetical protein
LFLYFIIKIQTPILLLTYFCFNKKIFFI